VECEEPVGDGVLVGVRDVARWLVCVA